MTALRKQLYLFAIFTFLFLANAQVIAQEASDSVGQALLQRLDDARFPGAYEMTVKMETSRPGRDMLDYTYDIIGIGSDKSLMTVTDPPSERDKQILLNGDNLYLYVPDVSRPVKLTRNASFMGSTFSNEDVMNSTLADDYWAKILNREERDGKVHFQAQLTAKRRNVAYAKMECGIDSATAIPDTITYFGLTGKALKQEIVNETAQLAGRLRPSVMTMYDFLEEGAFTKVTVSTLEEREDIPESTFDPTRMGN